MVLKLKRPVIIRNSLDTYDFMYAVIHGKDILEDNIHFDMAKEHFWVIALDRVDKTVNFELIAMGSDCQVTVDPVEVYSLPVYKRASGIILVHNHPSGTLYPSEPDKDITDNLIQAGRILKRPVRDHVIITEHSYYSFKNSGLFRILLQSIKYLPYYEREKQFEKEMDREIRKIKKEEQKKIKTSFEKGEIKGRKEEKIQIALIMRANGYKTDEIAQLTGLSASDIMNI